MEHINNCYRMALAAQHAYLDGKEGKNQFKTLGYTKHKFIEHDGAQCHLAWNDEEFLIAFRGTEPDEFSDIKADLNAIPDRAQVGGWVHNGFQEELNKIWEMVQAGLVNAENKRLYICGHSLGGAMATVAASRLNPDALYTYGSPRVGTSKFVKNITCQHYRHVNNNDVVPKVPFAFLGYRHHGNLRYINFYGNIRKLTYWQRFKDGWRGRMAAWKKREPFDGARDHSMTNYVKYLEKENA